MKNGKIMIQNVKKKEGVVDEQRTLNLAFINGNRMCYELCEPQKTKKFISAK